MDYLYYLGKASLVLRVVHYLRSNKDFSVQFMSILHQMNGWIVRIKPVNWPLENQANFQAFLNELGVAYRPCDRVQHVLEQLEAGDSPVEVMNRYHVAVIDHGQPRADEIRVFREQYIDGLGYCPETLA